MKTRQISTLTILAIMFSILGFTIYYSSHRPNNWTLPAFVAIILAEGALGMALIWRARKHN